MHGIAVVSSAVAPAAGAGRARADGGAKPAVASGTTPRNVSSACTARKDSVALGDRRFFGKARALRTVSVGPANSGRASRNLTVRHRRTRPPSRRRALSSTFSLFPEPPVRGSSLPRFSNAPRRVPPDGRRLTVRVSPPSQTDARDGRQGGHEVGPLVDEEQRVQHDGGALHG